MVAPWGHAWDMTRYGDTINERAVHILLECILVTIFSRKVADPEFPRQERQRQR